MHFLSTTGLLIHTSIPREIISRKKPQCTGVNKALSTRQTTHIESEAQKDRKFRDAFLLESLLENISIIIYSNCKFFLSVSISLTMVQFAYSSTITNFGTGRRRFAPRPLYPEKIFGDHWVGGWTGSRTRMDVLEKSKISCPCQERKHNSYIS